MSRCAEAFQVKVLPTTSRPVTTRIAWTTRAASETSTPELTATAADMPWRWKNRMARAALATLPPMKPVNWLAKLTADHRAQRQALVHRAEHGDGVADLGQLGEEGDHRDPGQVGVLERGAPVDLAELADQQVDAEDRAGGHEHVADRHPMQLHQLRRLDRQSIGDAVAQAAGEVADLGDGLLEGPGERAGCSRGSTAARPSSPSAARAEAMAAGLIGGGGQHDEQGARSASEGVGARVRRRRWPGR